MRFNGFYTSIPPLDDSDFVEHQEYYEEFPFKTPDQLFSLFRFYPGNIVALVEIHARYELFSRNSKIEIIKILRDEVFEKMGGPPEEEHIHFSHFCSDKLCHSTHPGIYWGKYEYYIMSNNHKEEDIIIMNFPTEHSNHLVEGRVKFDSLDITISESVENIIKDNLFEFVAFRFN
jgi:hypothetical protein